MQKFSLLSMSLLLLTLTGCGGNDGLEPCSSRDQAAIDAVLNVLAGADSSAQVIVRLELSNQQDADARVEHISAMQDAFERRWGGESLRIVKRLSLSPQVVVRGTREAIAQMAADPVVCSIQHDGMNVPQSS